MKKVNLASLLLTFSYASSKKKHTHSHTHTSHNTLLGKLNNNLLYHKQAIFFFQINLDLKLFFNERNVGRTKRTTTTTTKR